MCNIPFSACSHGHEYVVQYQAHALTNAVSVKDKSKVGMAAFQQGCPAILNASTHLFYKMQPVLEGKSRLLMYMQVSTECDPCLLLDYLSGESATAASSASIVQDRARQEEERLLKAACTALRAKHIIRVCSVHDHPQVCQAIQRLISNAAAVRQAVDLTGGTMHNLLSQNENMDGQCETVRDS